MPRQERTKNGTGIYHAMYGMKNDGTFGTIDDLDISYDGNQLVKVTDAAETLNYSDALDFHDGADMECEYDYDNNGALTKDSNRGIKSITYDYAHYPSYINMSIGSKIRYVANDYTPDGRKLSSKHRTFPSGNIFVTTTDLYVDGLMLRGDTTLLWRFDGGYVELNANGTPTRWNYYITRMVVDSNDSIRETISYYPFGSEMRISNPAQMSGDTSHPFRFTGKELDRQNSLNMYDFGARMFDVAGVPMWTSIDPLAEKYYGISPYAYCANNPVMLVDPDGNSPLSALIKVTAKQGVKAGIKTYVKNNIEHRLKNYMSDKMLKQFAKDVDDVMGTLDNSWWETALELVPVAGDIYGSTKFVKQVKKAYDKLQDLENKYVGKIYDALPKTERKKFVQNMRRKGVADARIDQAKGLDVGGDVKYEKGKGIDGHHSDKVSENPDKMTDPRKIEFMKQEDHIKYHQQYGY